MKLPVNKKNLITMQTAIGYYSIIEIKTEQFMRVSI
jgi:hypothetical protein